MSLLAIAAAVSLMVYIHSELQRCRSQPVETEDEEAKEECSPRESKEVVRFLTRMKASALVSQSAPRRNLDSDYDRN